MAVLYKETSLIEGLSFRLARNLSGKEGYSRVPLDAFDKLSFALEIKSFINDSGVS